MIRVCAVGTASTGKSALLNALFGTTFAVDPRGGTCGEVAQTVVRWDGRDLLVLDAPPWARSGKQSSVPADVYLLVCDKDLTETDFIEAVRISRARRPLAVVLNKADTFSPSQLEELLLRLRHRMRGIVPSDRVLACAAEPVRIIYAERLNGATTEQAQCEHPAVSDVRSVARELIAEAAYNPLIVARESSVAVLRHARKALSTAWKRSRRR